MQSVRSVAAPTLAALTLTAVCGLMVACSRTPDEQSSPAAGDAKGAIAGKPAQPAAPAPTATSDPGEAVAELTATVKLVAQEYALAVDDGGKVIDDIELAEAELFTDQARLKYQRLSPQVKTAHRSEAATVAEAIDGLGKAVTERRPPTEVRSLADRAASALAALGPTESAATAGLRAATAQADRAIVAEKVAGEYRVGVLVEAPRRVYRRGADGTALETKPPDGAGSFIGVVLRERRTKRFLPAAGVTVSVVAPSSTEPATPSTRLAELWSDFPQYGGHLPAIGAPSGKLRVHIDPPECARHGDMLSQVSRPADAEFEFAARDGRPAFVPNPPAPIDRDYAIGDDIMRGLAEAREIVDAGEYRVGFIAEAPEPIWLWKGGPQLKAVSSTDTHHLEILLLDKASGQLVPEASVALTMTPLAGGTPIVARLHNLLSAYQHYGETLRVPPGDYTVRVDVEPPRFDVTDASRFSSPARAEFGWTVPPPQHARPASEEEKG